MEKDIAKPAAPEAQQPEGGVTRKAPPAELLASKMSGGVPQQDAFGDFMDQLKQLEAGARGDGYSLKQIITSFRMIYYNNTRAAKEYAGSTVSGGAWNILIPAASGQQLPKSWGEAKLAPVVESIRKKQVTVINGVSVDIGHLLAGLDAGQNPTSINLALGTVKMKSNKEASTFVGDLGSVVGEYIMKDGAKKDGSGKQSFYDLARVKNDELTRYYTENHSDADFAGNADAYGLVIDSNKTLAQNLEAYYVKDRKSQSDKRYTKLAKSIGFVNAAGGFNYGIKTTYKDEVFNAAQAYVAGKGKKSDVLLINKDPGPGFQTDIFGLDLGTPTFWEMYYNVSGWTVDLFLDRLKAKVEAEK